MSVALYLITDRSLEKHHLTDVRPFGGKTICFVLWGIVIPRARRIPFQPEPTEGTWEWDNWHSSLQKAMAQSFIGFETLMNRAALGDDSSWEDQAVSIGEFYPAIVAWYEAMANMSFRRQYPHITVNLTPDVMAMLNVLEREILTGADRVAMGAE